MFDTRPIPEPDKILRLMAMFAADPRPVKVDLGVGVYRDAQGRTPVMGAVKAAEARILQAQETKGYVGLSGDPAFLSALRDLVLGASVDPARVAAAATPGGTGAVRQVLEMTRRLTPDAIVWLPDPTWPNHSAILDFLGARWRSFRYYDAEAGSLDCEGMLADLAQARAGDLILLHGCCHNPTGVDLNSGDWDALADLCGATGAIPFVDLAYLGFADGLEEDAAGLRLLAARLPEMLVAVSASKNFGLYRERVGAVLAVTSGPGPAAAANGILANLNRQNYAFPPDHGARIVQTILSDPDLCDAWRAELRAMRERMNGNRAALAAALRDETGSDRFAFLGTGRGMFGLIGASPEEVARLRKDHGIYLVGDGRMNVAGLTAADIPLVARAVAAVLG